MSIPQPQNIKKQLLEQFPNGVKFGPAVVEAGRGSVIVQVSFLITNSIS